VTRDDHSQIMNTMIRFYSAAKEAEKKQAMAFELSPFDENALKFGRLFRERFMDLEVSLPLDDALDLSWQTLAECFEQQELLMKQSLIDKYFPKETAGGTTHTEDHDGSASPVAAGSQPGQDQS